MANKSRNIKIITFNNFPYGGAAANYIRYLAQALTESGNNVEVLLPAATAFGISVEPDVSKKGTIGNVKYRHLFFSRHPKNIIIKIFSIGCGIFNLVFNLVYLSLFKKDIDIVVCYDTSFIYSCFYLSIIRLLRIKLINILPEYYEKPKNIGLNLDTFRWYDFYFYIKHMTKYSNGSIVLSNYLKDYLVSAGKKEENIIIIPNIIDPSVFDKKNIKPFKEDYTTIGYAGTPTKKDGISDLIKSFSILNKKYRNTHLLIIGDITNGDSVIPELKIFASAIGIPESCITFTGLQSYVHIPELLHSCQILALTRPNGIFAEAGFPTKLGEYFACKKPVVVTKVGDIPLYFNNEEHAILVEPENIKSIVLGFEKLINNKDLAFNISNNAYLWVNENLNYKNISCKIEVFINHIQNIK